MALRTLHRTARFTAAAYLLSAVPAFAQATPPKPPAAPGKQKPAPKPDAPAAPAEQKPEDATKAEAARRFERGLTLFNAGDNAGALAEFKRIYEILPNPVVLFNIGLVYAAMARPVDAVDALESAVQSNALSAKDLERAQATLADQKARVARLSVTTTPEGARIEIDGVQVARTPLTAPLRIAEGNHIVGAVAEGFAPARKELVVAGNVDASLHLDLVPQQSKQLANLSLRSATLGAEVRVDGQSAGTTPLSTSITLSPGVHVLELARAGYVAGRREIELGAGAMGEVVLDLAVDPAALGREGATLVIDASESPVELTVDGERRGPYTGPVRLPRGPHHIAVAAPAFIPAERDVNLDPSVTNVVRLVLEPTPETREAYRSKALMHRTWGWVGIASGAAFAGAGVTLAVLGASQKKDGQDGIAEVNRKLLADEPPCDAQSGFAAEPDMTGYQCDLARANAQDKVDAGKTKSILGYVGIGVGGALAVTGVVLLLTGDDPNKYEQPRAKRAGPRWALLPGPGELGAAVGATF
jgi:tetratricopeptide (TPR) repeat protein